MIKDSYSEKDTWELVLSLGEKAGTGQIFTSDWRSGCGENRFYERTGQRAGNHRAGEQPDFTILQVYEEGRLPFYHFDVYRIGDVEEMDEIGYEDYFYGDGVCLIEWADLIEEILPEHYTQIQIEKRSGEGI